MKARRAMCRFCWFVINRHWRVGEGRKFVCERAGGMYVVWGLDAWPVGHAWESVRRFEGLR